MTLYNKNIFQFSFVLLTLVFCGLRLFQFWGEFQSFDLFALTNGYAIFFILSPVYFLYLKNFSVAIESFKDLLAIVKEYFSNVLSIAMIASGGLFLMLATNFDYFVFILFVEQFLFTTILVFAIMTNYKNYSNSVFLVVVLAIWQLMHMSALASFESSWILWLNPLSSWSYLSWYFESYIYILPILLKWIMLFPFLKLDRSNDKKNVTAL